VSQALKFPEGSAIQPDERYTGAPEHVPRRQLCLTICGFHAASQSADESFAARTRA